MSSLDGSDGEHPESAKAKPTLEKWQVFGEDGKRLRLAPHLAAASFSFDDGLTSLR